jgi:signal transduction histidine kinase
MVKRSLSRLLQYQWWMHTALTSLFFIGVTFFFLFSIEDYYHEEQLKDLSNIVSVQSSLSGLPEHISGFAHPHIPVPWLEKLETIALGQALEIAGENGHQIHLIKQQYKDSSSLFVLALYTEKTRSIWRNMDKLALLIVPWTLLFFTLASFMSRKFIRQFHGQFITLLDIIKRSESTKDLSRYTQAQSIKELAEYAAYFEQVWQEKLDVIARERQGLEYLSHELRTPIQSSIATLELLALKHPDKSTIERLMRSLKRMTRLSNGILCLMEADTTLSTYSVDVQSICEELIEELTPLVNAKNQTIELLNNFEQQHGVSKLTFDATREAVETVLSILIMNAIQHSDSSPICITLYHNRITVLNRAKAQSDSAQQPVSQNTPNFGIGLIIAKRLAQRFDLTLEISTSEDSAVTAQLSKLVFIN